jgi:glycerol-3-phosphate dehydrogenase (NAD(P)+)
MNIAILGTGAWGTALAISLAARHQVHLWGRNAEQVAQMAVSRSNQRYLPGFVFPPSMQVHSDLEIALKTAELVLSVVPTAGFRHTLPAVAATGAKAPVVWASKGFEAGTAKLPHQVVSEVLKPGIPCGVLSGPSFAQEVAAGLPTALTLASSDVAFAQAAAGELHSPRLRIYHSDDVVGVEVGGAVKNVMAIAAGICDGLKLGHSGRAALITRGLAEINRLGTALGGKPETFTGLTGLGDLILTCTGDLSRNRTVGLKLAQGESLEKILRDLGHTAEGVSTAREVVRMADRFAVEMPISRAVCRVLYEGLPAKDAVEELLNREPKSETGKDVR